MGKKKEKKAQKKKKDEGEVLLRFWAGGTMTVSEFQACQDRIRQEEHDKLNPKEVETPPPVEEKKRSGFSAFAKKKGYTRYVDPNADPGMDPWEEEQNEKLERKARFAALPPDQQWELLIAATVDRNRWKTCHTITVGIA